MDGYPSTNSYLVQNIHLSRTFILHFHRKVHSGARKWTRGGGIQLRSFSRRDFHVCRRRRLVNLFRAVIRLFVNGHHRHSELSTSSQLSLRLLRLWLTRELIKGHLLNDYVYIFNVLCHPKNIYKINILHWTRSRPNYNLHLHLGSGTAATAPSIVLEGQEEDRWRQFFLGVTIVDDRFNSLDIVAEEKFVLSFGVRRWRR